MTQRYSALICALFASLMLSQAPAHASDLDEVMARGTLKVAVPQDFPPFGSVGPDMHPQRHHGPAGKHRPGPVRNGRGHCRRL